jgi:integrase
MRGGDGIWRRRDRHNQWWISWKDAKGKRRKKRARRQSYEGAKQELARLQSGLETVAETGSPRFADYAKRWMASHVTPILKPSTVESYEVILRLHLFPRFGRLSLESLTRKSIKSYLDDLVAQGQHSRNTIKNILATLRALLSQAVEDDLLPSNPAMRLGRFNRRQGDGRKPEFLTQEEGEHLLEVTKVLHPHFYPLLLTALRTGMRLGEILAVQWDDIQFGESEVDTNRYILVRRNFTRGQFTEQGLAAGVARIV